MTRGNGAGDRETPALTSYNLKQANNTGAIGRGGQINLTDTEYTRIAMVLSKDLRRDNIPDTMASALQVASIDYWRLGEVLHRIEDIANGQAGAGNLTANNGMGDCERGGLLTSVQCQVAQVCAVMRRLRILLEEDPNADLIIDNRNR